MSVSIKFSNSNLRLNLYGNSKMLKSTQEMGAQIAKSAEKYQSKTEEERKEEVQKEDLGEEENKGRFTESMEELSKATEEMTEEAAEEIEEDLKTLSEKV